MRLRDRYSGIAKSLASVYLELSATSDEGTIPVAIIESVFIGGDLYNAPSE